MEDRASRFNIHIKSRETVNNRETRRTRALTALCHINDTDGLAGEFYKYRDLNGLADDTRHLSRRLGRISKLLPALVAKILGMRAAKVEFKHRQT